MKWRCNNTSIPDWLRDNIMLRCPYDNYPLVDNESLTMSVCPNPLCPGHMSHKMDYVAKRLGASNFGPAAALDFIIHNHPQSHLAIVPYLSPNEKPELYLWEIGELCLIPNYRSKWQHLAGKYNSMSAFLDSPDCPSDLKEYRDFLIYNEKYFRVKKAITGRDIHVMLSGSFNGYSNRSDFVAFVNSLYGDYYRVIDIGKRKLDCDYLIKEQYTSDHSKTQIAKEYGIPIVTPSEFLDMVRKAVEYKRENG